MIDKQIAIDTIMKYKLVENIDNIPEIAINNMIALLNTVDQFNLEINDKLFSDKDVIFYPGLSKRKNATKTLAVLILLYQEECRTIDIINKIKGTQPASQIRELRNKGFVFDAGNKIKRGNYYIKEENDENLQYRKITGFDPPPIINNYWNKLTEKQERIFKLRGEDYLGSKITVDNCEIDHRLPENTRKKFSINPVRLTCDSILDKTAFEHYVILTRNNNDIKREACNKCLAGCPIPLPQLALVNKKAYKQQLFEDDNKKENPCQGCFWYDYLKPLYPELLSGLDYALEIENNIRDEIVSKIKKIK